MRRIFIARNDRALALAVDARGNLYITGKSTGLLSGADLLTLKYSPGSPALTRWHAATALGQTLWHFCFRLPAGRQ